MMREIYRGYQVISNDFGEVTIFDAWAEYVDEVQTREEAVKLIDSWMEAR